MKLYRNEDRKPVVPTNFLCHDTEHHLHSSSGTGQLHPHRSWLTLFQYSRNSRLVSYHKVRNSSEQAKAGGKQLFFLDWLSGSLEPPDFLSDIGSIFWNLFLSSLISPKHRQWFYNKQLLCGLQGIIILGLEAWPDGWRECTLPGVSAPSV